METQLNLKLCSNLSAQSIHNQTNTLISYFFSLTKYSSSLVWKNYHIFDSFFSHRRMKIINQFANFKCWWFNSYKTCSVHNLFFIIWHYVIINSNDRFKWIFCTRFEAEDNARNKKNFLLRLKLFENEQKKKPFPFGKLICRSTKMRLNWINGKTELVIKVHSYSVHMQWSLWLKITNWSFHLIQRDQLN